VGASNSSPLKLACHKMLFEQIFWIDPGDGKWTSDLEHEVLDHTGQVP
jgi:hypothetical protein